MITLATRCHCGAALVLYEPASWDNWAVHCPDCLDDAEDAPASASITGRGATPEDALQNWFDAREEAGAEPALVPSTIHSFVVPNAPDGVFAITTTLEPRAFEQRYSHTHNTRNIDEAQSYAAGVAGRGSIPPIYYAPTPTQKAANQ